MKQHRTEVIKVLRQQMEAETDPQKKVEYAKQLAKLLPRPRQARRTRKSVEAAPSKAKASLLTRIHHNGLDDLSPQNKLRHLQVIEFEKREKEHRKHTGQKLTEEDEKKALWVEVDAFIDAQLTEEDDALLADEAQAAESAEVLKGC